METTPEARKEGRTVQLTMELRRPAGAGYEPVAWLTVYEDHSTDTKDPEGVLASVLDLNLAAHTLDAAGEHQMVTFDEDPAAWARGLRTRLRTGYLVPVVTYDAAASAGTEGE